MSTETLLRQAVRGALAVGAVSSMIGVSVALAQTAPAAGTAGGTTKLSKIVVTGSHIPQTAIANAQPIITISRQQIETSGFTTVGTLLQNMSSAGPALNTMFNNGGTGQVFFDLHNLGSSRVLILVNGQRWLPTLGGSVDISTIPTAIVDHIEVLMDGASAIYGSEAMAGVVNIVTVKNFNGAEVSAYLGSFDGHGDGGGWDGKTQNYSFTVGTSGDRSSVLLSAGYRNQNPVWAGQRWISKYPLVGTGTTFGSSGTPNGRFVFYDPNFASHPGYDAQACSSSAAFGYPGCNFTGPIPMGSNPWAAAPFTKHFNYAPLNYLLTPQETWYVYSQGHYDLTDNITFNFTADYNRRNSAQVLAPNPWFFGLAGSEMVNGHAIGVAANNPYNPFGVDLVPGFPSYGSGAYFCQNYGSANCASNYETLFFYGRRPLELGNRVFSQNNQTFYFNGGFTGYWEMFGNQWTWNTHALYSQSLNTWITSGLSNTARIAEALGTKCPSNSSCVPLNLFGGVGTILPDQANYVLFTAHRDVATTTRDYNANIGGSFWNNWYAGPWGAAAGYEYQEIDGFNSPDALVALGNTVGNAQRPTTGRENINAQYVELNIPFASNIPFAKSIDLDLANRWSQFRWQGIGAAFQNNQVISVPVSSGAHSSTARATLKWQPIEQLLFRGTWAAGFRIPSLSDLFSGAQDNFPVLHDPCALGPYGGWAGPPAPLPPGCGTQHGQPLSQIHTTNAGNAFLQPEKSISQSVGFVWSPTFAQGLDISADYYKVEVVSRITRKGGQYYLNQCYNLQNASACAAITVAAGTVRNINDFNINSGSFRTNGWDAALRYKLPTTPIGDFTVGLNMNFVKFVTFCNSVGNCSNAAGSASSFSGTPKHKYNLNVGWDYGPWAATWRVSLISRMYESCISYPGFCSDPTDNLNAIGTTIYHDVQASYNLSSWNTTFTLGVQNLFDKQPPIAGTAFANSFFPTFYRVPGRFFYGKATVRF